MFYAHVFGHVPTQSAMLQNSEAVSKISLIFRGDHYNPSLSAHRDVYTHYDLVYGWIICPNY